MNENEIVLSQATFNPKFKTYIFLVVVFYLIVSVIGLLIIPFWLLGLGQWLSNKFFHSLKCELTNKNLRFSKGFIFHIEKTIPLENIQDLSFYGGPLLRSLGLTFIKIETAGGGGKHSFNMMSIPAVNNAEKFKTEILNEREKLILSKYTTRATTGFAVGTDTNNLLIEIKQELVEIKNSFRKT